MRTRSFPQSEGPIVGNSLAQTLGRAIAAHNVGDLAQAELFCKLVLAAQRNHFGALHLLGIIDFQRGRHAEALQLIRRALKINPRSPAAHLNYGLVINSLKGPAEALLSLDRALALEPNHVIALNNRGNALWRLKRHEEALASLDQALSLQPDYADALSNRGNVLCELKRFDEALVSYDKAVAINPHDHLAWHNRGNALFQLERFDEALASNGRSLAIKPDDVLVVTDCGKMLEKLERWEEALATFERVLAIDPDNLRVLNCRGNCLWHLKRPAEAVASYDRALALKPDEPEYHGNRANALQDLGRLEEALAGYDRVLVLTPDHAEHRWNRGLARLRLGDYEAGWEDYEWRFKKADTVSRLRQFAQQRWDGQSSLEGKTILLHTEQGLGDTIQFARYVPWIAGRGGKVVLEVQQALKSLLAGLEGAPHVIGEGEELPPIDCHYPLLSLPLAFKTTLETIPAAIPYLSPSPDRVSKWTERLAGSGMPRVGIAWAGSPNFIDDRNRSIGLPSFSPLLSVPGVEFFSIQKVLRPGDEETLMRNPHVKHLGGEIEDFDDTAAIMSLMDLVVSSDTSVVHLAGALGRPVWILLQFAADWRWLSDREDNPWYRTARLFRQPTIADWQSVVDRVGDELARWRNYDSMTTEMAPVLGAVAQTR